MSGDIHTIKRTLNDRIVSVCEHLYPGGKVVGPEYVIDPGTGKIKVVVRGAKVGVWSHFGGSEDGGDVIDLWQHSRGQTLVETLDDIRSFLGIERPNFQVKPQRQWNRPAKPRCTTPQGLVRDYLTEARNIPEPVLKRYLIGEQDRNIVFPFMRDGDLIMAKVREAVDGARPKPTEAKCEKILFGWQAVDANARSILITEGEIDALSMAAYTDIPALSVPFGGGSGGKQDWIENEFERLQRFERIYLCMDNDEEGEKAKSDIARRLGSHRCLIVTLPRKDANECLVDGVPEDEIAQCIANAKTLDPEGLRRPTDYLTGLVKLFYPEPGDSTGYTLPFRATGTKLCFRPGELTLWSGPTGAGKSILLSHAALGWIDQGSTICIASLEMAPVQTLRRMVRQVANTGNPTREMIDASVGWLNDNLLIYDFVGKAGVKPLLDVFEYARARYGCDQFIIDSFMRLGIASDDYRAQEEAMFEVINFAVENQVHVHLVAHTRKSGQERREPTADDVKGAGEIASNAPNILTISRNRNRENAEAKGEPEDEAEREKWSKIMAMPGVYLNCIKQRNGDWEGRVGLWFSLDSYQYRGTGDDRYGAPFVRLSVPDLMEQEA